MNVDARIRVAGLAIGIGSLWACASAAGSEDAIHHFWPPYSADSPWNTPISDGAPIHPDSAALVQRLGSTVTADTSQYTIPVYQVSSGTPLTDVKTTFLFSQARSGGTGVKVTVGEKATKVPMPDDAFSAQGSDGLIVIWNPDTGDEWGFFQAWEQADGTWEATNGYQYNTAWSGVAPPGFTSRGLGAPYLAGLLRPIDFDDGRIDHALAFGYATPSPEYVWPAVKSDGRGEIGVDLPEGARLQLDPSKTRDELTALGLNEYGIAIARALQDYGMILTDVSGSTKIYAEYDFSAGWDPSLMHRDVIADIPVHWFRVLDYEESGQPDVDP